MIFDEISTGAADDLDKATEIARSMVTRYGMAEDLGQMSYERPRAPFLGNGGYGGGQARDYSEETAREIDCAVRHLTDRARERAEQILQRNRRQLEEGAALLLERETLVSSDLATLAPDATTEGSVSPD